MKTVSRTLLGLVVVFAVVLMARAEDKKETAKEVTLKGQLVCTKCALKQTKSCGNALKVKTDDKEVIYFFKDDGKAAEYHVCAGSKEATVTGTVSKEKGKDGKEKMVLTPAKDGVKTE